MFFLVRVWRVAIERLRPRKMIVLSSLMIVAFIVLNIIDSSEYTMSSNEWEGNFPILFAKLILSSCGLSGLFLSFHFPRVPIINYIGQHSMVFFVAHYPIITFYKMLRSAFVHTLNGKIDDLIIMSILTFVLCAWLVPYVERIPWLSGRFQKKTSDSPIK
jgi:peptidoglycan/LPS O-acetylase OafA/YrhL